MAGRPAAALATGQSRDPARTVGRVREGQSQISHLPPIDRDDDKREILAYIIQRYYGAYMPI